MACFHPNMTAHELGRQITTCYSRKHPPVGEGNATEHLSPEGNEVAQSELLFVKETPDKD